MRKWKIIEEFPAYEVSSDGMVRKNERKIAVHMSSSGKRRVRLFRDGKPHSRCIHLLVLEAFYGRRPSSSRPVFLDGDSKNCHLTNLKWESCHISISNNKDIYYFDNIRLD